MKDPQQPADMDPQNDLPESVSENESSEDSALIGELKNEIAMLKDQALRALAEAENTRRRAAKERDETAKYAVTSFAKDMVSVADNLRRALEAVPSDVADPTETLKTLMAGVEATERQLLSALEKSGIQRLHPLDQPFDPHFHRVMFEVETAEKPPGTIMTVLQPGYVIHDRLLREALVGVAKAPNA